MIRILSSFDSRIRFDFLLFVFSFSADVFGTSSSSNVSSRISIHSKLLSLLMLFDFVKFLEEFLCLLNSVELRFEDLSPKLKLTNSFEVLFSPFLLVSFHLLSLDRESMSFHVPS